MLIRIIYRLLGSFLVRLHELDSTEILSHFHVRLSAVHIFNFLLLFYSFNVDNKLLGLGTNYKLFIKIKLFKK